MPSFRRLPRLLAALLAATTAANALVTNPKEYLLSPKWNITDRPQVRRFNFTAVNVTSSAADGYARPVLVINNMLPGPLIEVRRLSHEGVALLIRYMQANTGDTIEVNLTNHLQSGVTLHWHGTSAISLRTPQV